MKRALGLIALLVACILVLRPLLGRLHGVAIVLFPWLLLPPRLRVVAAVLAVLAVLALFGVCPRLRAAWQRWLSGLGIVLVFLLLLRAFGPLPPLTSRGPIMG
jgi:hypothetical protein